MAFEYKCGSCNNFKDKNDTNKPFDVRWAKYEKGYCDWYRSFYWADDSCSPHYQNRGGSSSTCYITTVVCNILGYPDNCGVLETLRSFRNNIMQKDEKYKKMLYEYDTVGPKIADSLLEDYEKTKEIELSTLLFNFYIQPTTHLIEQKQYGSAVERYQEMTKSLEEYYQITPDGAISGDYDYTTGGHGRLIKTIQEEI